MFCIQRLKYIALFLLLAFIIFGCGKDPADPVFDNPFDPQNPKTNGEPYHLQVSVGDKNAVNLKWNQIDNAKKFSVYRSSSSDNEYKLIGISTSTDYVDSNIDANVTYNYKIRAYLNETEASPSSIASITPLIVYTITATAENGGSISPSGNVKVTNGLSQTFSISPNAEYSVLDVKIDGVSKGNISSYTFSNVTTDHTIKASFSRIGTNTFTITATAEIGGSISPSGNVKVANGSSQTFDISPNIGYSILDVQIDGKSIGKVDKYTFDNITANHQIKAIFEMNSPDITGMVLIPAGEFQMGDSLNEGNANELPVHTVYLDAFYIDKYEVTNAQYKKFMDATGYKAPIYWNDPDLNVPNSPVVGISWNDAKSYADWAGKRLPTEAEWEKSARGGLISKRYPWGNTITHDNANYDGTGGKDVWKGTSPVNSFALNGYGLYDMAGNVWEWCADWYSDNYYSSSPKSNPTGPGSGSRRILRGGSWGNPDNLLRVSYRNHSAPTSMTNVVGFRCVQ